jgi:glycosyltransferase involved in cell wall biosynthesis
MPISSTKHIGIDCRFWGLRHAGLGRYTRDLVLSMVKQLNFDAKFTLFFQKGEWLDDQKDLGDSSIVEVDIPHYSLKEQALYWRTIGNYKLDLVHYPHFNIPVLSDTPFVVTIHDLIKHFFKGKPVTTRNSLVYWIKYGGYHLTINTAIKKAYKIITPSQFTKDQVVSHYPGVSNKIEVIYEGVNSSYMQKDDNPVKKHPKKLNIKSPFFTYTGSAYPSKNIPVLLDALKLLVDRQVDVSLLMTCARNSFWEKLEKDVKSRELEKHVVLPGRVADEDLSNLYKEATALVMPSLMEGFGLPGLEAMAAGCPVIASEAGSLPEVYGSAALYFHPERPEQLAEIMESMLQKSSSEREFIIKKGKKQANKYSWDKAAKETLSIYKNYLQI